jgi:hypothetical protein
MKKIITILALILAFNISASGQTAAPIDLIVLLDTSASMSSSYRETSDYMIGPFLREFLRIGDTFHLISFSGSPKLEISRRIEGVGDVEAIIGRILLMYPLEPQSDLSGALSFAEGFSSSLPLGRSKKLVLLSDGDAPNTVNMVNDAAGRLKSKGTELQFIKVPVSGTGPSSGRPQASSQTSVQPGQESGQSQGQTIKVTPVSPVEQQTPSQVSQPTGSQTGTAQTEEPKTEVTQVGGTSGSQSASSGIAAGSQTQTPDPQRETFTQTGTTTASSGIPLPLLIGLGILALLILALIIFFAVRNLHNSPNRVMAQAATSPKDAELMNAYAENQTKQARPDLEYPPPKAKTPPKDKFYDSSSLTETNGGPLMLNLFVEDQNTAIGKRNIHAVKSGNTFSIGGGKSDFLIFLVQVPPHIADLYYDGRNCTFVPRKPKYFPDIGSQSVPNCVGKTIRIVSDRNYELFMRMEKYEDPLNALNRMLRSIKVPGEVK